MSEYVLMADYVEDVKKYEATLRALMNQVTEHDQHIGALDRKWQEDHTTLYLLLHQRMGELQGKLAEQTQKHYSQAYDLLTDIDALTSDGSPLPTLIAERVNAFLATHPKPE